MPVLQANEIRKSFKEGKEVVNVLDGVSFLLEPGEVTALEGPSGSGKTTLLSILGCILTPSSGELVIDGERVDSKKASRLPAIRRRSIGFVFQQFNLFPALTAVENVEYGLNIKPVALFGLGILLTAYVVFQIRGVASNAGAAPTPARPVSGLDARIRAEGRLAAYPGAQVVVGTDFAGTLTRLSVKEKDIVR